MSDTDFNLDDAVENEEGVEEEWDSDEVEGSGDEFSVEDVETVESEGDEGEGAEKPKASKKKGPGYGELPASEFKFDATPKPRVAGEKKDGDKAPARQKDELPEGWVTPTGLVNHLRTERIVDLKPQAMYGFVKNGREFPYVIHTDGRYIVPLTDKAAANVEFGQGEKKFTQETPKGGVTWVVEHLTKRAEREQARAAEAAKAQEETDSEPANDQPVVEGVEEVASFES